MAAKKQKEQLYKRYDLQDEDNYEIETLEEIREWLADFWNNNPNDDMTERDLEELTVEIMKSDVDEVSDRLGGIDYGCEEWDGER